MATRQTWMIRAGEYGYLFEEFRSRSIVAIGWAAVGDLSNVEDDATIEKLVRTHHPEYIRGKTVSTKSQLRRFRFDLKKNDCVVTYNASERTYLIGDLVGDYDYRPDLIPEFPHTREVRWRGEASRDSLSTMAKNSLGSSLTIFEVSDPVISELQESLARDAPTTPILEADAGELQEIKEDFEAKSHEFMKDAISRLDWEEMQYLVAGLLRAMGYRTRVSRRGPDRGRDVIASPDGLGLEEPRIVVEVKHRQGVASTQMLRSFLGGLRGTDRGIFVSTGGFSREAQYEAERSNVPCSLIDLDHFVELITDYYDKFDPESRSLLPLRKVYWPV